MGALYRSGVEALDFACGRELGWNAVYGADWLTAVRLPVAIPASWSLREAYRIVDLTCGSYAWKDTPRLRRLRSMAMRWKAGDDASCSLSSAWITAELAAQGGRHGFPALPL
jgi:hypothetical protein